FTLHGRESQTQIAYDYDGRRIEYHARGETFFLRRVRVVDDVLTIPEGLHVDDAISASLNYRDGRWTPDAQGRLRTHIVRRRRSRASGRSARSTSRSAAPRPTWRRRARGWGCGRPGCRPCRPIPGASGSVASSPRTASTAARCGWWTPPAWACTSWSSARRRARSGSSTIVATPPSRG